MSRTTAMRALPRAARPVAAAFGLVALLGVIPANAADPIVNEEAAPAAPMENPPVASWAGAYAGLQLGYGFAGRTHTDGRGPASPETVDTDGFVGGGFAGIQGQSDSVVYGVEGDLGYSGLKGEDGGVKSRGGLEGSMRGRLGYAVTPDVLLYGTAGGAAQRLKVSQGGESDSNGMLGYTVGAGADVKLSENVFARAEYRFTDFGKENFDLGSGSQEVDARNQRVMLGLGYHF